MKDNILEYFVNHNIDITISKNNTYGLYYNLNISDNKKYYAYLSFIKKGEHSPTNDVNVVIYTRQQPEGHVVLSLTEEGIIKEICQCVKNLFDVDSYDYIDTFWKELLVEQKILKKSLEKVYTIENVYHD